MVKLINVFLIISILLRCHEPVSAQKIDTSSNRVKTDFSINFKRIGTIKPKNTNEITSSNWILGCETLDRDLTDYEQYKEYIVPLGIKRLRMQAGWAKTEKTKEQYDFGHGSIKSSTMPIKEVCSRG